MSDKRYPKNCYKMLKSLDDIGRRNWATDVKELLFKYGFGFIWVSQDVGDIDLFMVHFKQRLTDCATQTWHENINDSSRCDTYRQFKSLLNAERYLDIAMPFYCRQALARFRCSSHRFQIELGRQLGIPRNLRICAHCQSENESVKIEDEYHVFFECSKYAEIRQTYLYNWYHGRHTILNFFDLLRNENEFVIRKIAFYVNQLIRSSYGT